MSFLALPNATLVQEALQNGRFEQVAELLDELELQVVTVALPADWPYTIQLLSHLHNFGLEDARFLWKRIPSAAKHDPELQAAFVVLQHLWNKDYEGIWAALTAFTWQPAAQPLAVALTQRVRQRTLGVLSAAYSTISVPRAASLLGLSETDTIALTKRAGWEHNAAANMLTVHKQDFDEPAPSFTQHLQRLTEYTLSLEAEAVVG